jgi:hypothetical protein
LIGKGSSKPEFDWLNRKKLVKTKLEEGKHLYPFNIQLPDLLPGCVISTEAKILYELKVEVISANKKMSNLYSIAEVPIGGSLYDLNFIGNNTKEVELKESKNKNKKRQNVFVNTKKS